MILIGQCAYYNALNARLRRHGHGRGRRSSSSSPSASDEERPLLQRRRSSSLGLPGSHRRHATHEESTLDPLRKMVTGEDETPDSRPWLHNSLSLLAVYVVGAAGWFVSSRIKDGAVPDASSPGSDDAAAAAAAGGEDGEAAAAAAHWGLMLGYFSALCYLLARIPQIVKNWQEKSCEGLALLFFLLSITGNLTYGLSVLTYSQKPERLLAALPWLLGSLGTIVEDCIIFVQFRIYSKGRRGNAEGEGEGNGNGSGNGVANKGRGRGRGRQDAGENGA